MTLPLFVVLLASPAVEISLERYEALTQKKEPSSFTLVESVRVAGSFASGVTLTLSGRAGGERPPVAVLDGDQVLLEGCVGEAVLQRDGNRVSVVPLAERFTVRCRLRGPAEWTAAVVGAADIGGALADGRVIVRIEGGITRLEVKRPEPELPREATEDALPPSLVGRYRITVSPDDTRFRWELSVHNPNRHAVSFPLRARAGETIEKIESQARHEAIEGGITVELNPGETDVAVEGTMTGTVFAPPIDGAAQYVLVDGHPLLRFEIESAGKRISAAETGLKAQYRAAQALLLARGQHVAWRATVLETMPSTSYTVSSVRSAFFVGADGALFGQSDVVVENEGASELALPMRGTPEFAALGGKAVPLVTTKQGDLSLPLQPGRQDVSVLYRGKLETGFGFAHGALELPGVGAVATQSSVELRAGRDWLPVFQRYGGHRWFKLPGPGDVVLTILFGLWAMHLFSSFGLSRKKSATLGSITALLASSTGAAYWPVVCALAGGSMLWVVAWLRESRIRLVAPSGLAGIVTVAGLGMIAMVGGVTLFGDNVRRLFGMSADALAGDPVHSGLTSKTMKNFGSDSVYGGEYSTGSSTPPPPRPQQTYVGVGAPRTLPQGLRRVELSEEMADTTAPAAASVVLVSASLAHALYVLLNLLAVALAFTMRRQLLGGIKAQLERLLAARPAEPAPPSPQITAV